MRKRSKVIHRKPSASKGTTVQTALRRRNRGAPKEGSVLSIVEPSFVVSRLSGYHPPNLFRDGDYLHVSDLLHKCVRMIALSKRYNLQVVGDRIYDNTGVTFAIGHAIQDYITDKLKKTSPDKLFGVWSCACGYSKTTTVYSKALEEGKCSRCDTSLSKYNELVFKDDEYGISGSVDVCLLEDGHYYIVESKSIKKEDFEVLARPLPDHLIQATFYWWLAQRSKVPLVDQASIVYTNKAYTMASPFKELSIKPSKEVHRLESYLEDAKAYKESLAGGDLPLRICPSPSSPAAKKCHACNICFSV